MNGISNIQMLDINQMQRMPIDEIVGLYRQGYRLSNSPIGIGIKSLATCPTGGVVQKGSTKNIEVKVTAAGTPPYTFKVQRDGTEILTYTGGATDILKTWPYVFNETLGTYTYTGLVTDSCSSGAKISPGNSCTVTVQEAPVTPPAGVSPLLIIGALGLVGLFIVMKK